MSLLTHERAVSWVCANLGGNDAGRHNGYHVHDRSGSRVRVAGRHIEGRMPLYFTSAPASAPTSSTSSSSSSSNRIGRSATPTPSPPTRCPS